MDVDEKPIVPRQRDLDANFVDDDELQAALARSRKAKLRKAKKMTPEELAMKSTSEFTLPDFFSSDVRTTSRTAKSAGGAGSHGGNQGRR